MSDIPPKQSPDAQHYDTSEPSNGLVAMYNAASHANAESFPVLKAFQDYIEAERTQARKRVMQLSIFFAVLMVVVVTGFLAAGIAMQRNTADLQAKLLNAVLNPREMSAPHSVTTLPPPPVIAQESPFFEESIRLMTKTTTDLQSSLDKKMDNMSDLTSKVHDRVTAQDDELGKLRDELRDMREQSERLKDELVTLKTTPSPPPRAAASAAAAPSPALAAAMPSPKQPGTTTASPDPRFPPATKEPPTATDGVTAPPAPQGRLATAIPLKAKNTGTIPWRVLIPD